MDAPNPVFMVAQIQYHTRDDNVQTVKEVVHYHDPWPTTATMQMTPAEYCAHIIAMTRNIAATWDVIDVQLFADRMDFICDLGAIDVTEVVKEAYDRIYTSRRHEYVR
jgi:hypothetical protein